MSFALCWSDMTEQVRRNVMCGFSYTHNEDDTVTMTVSSAEAGHLLTFTWQYEDAVENLAALARTLGLAVVRQ